MFERKSKGGKKKCHRVEKGLRQKGDFHILFNEEADRFSQLLTKRNGEVEVK